MAIKQKRSAIYLSDRGDEYELSQMHSSHILNVLAHHQKQIDALELLPGSVRTALLDKRIMSLRETIKVLAEELGTRDPDQDEVISRGY